MTRSVAGIAWLALLFVAGCGEAPSAPRAASAAPPPGPLIEIRTLVPIEAAADGVDPAARWPSGSRVIRVDPADPEAAPVILSKGLDAAGGVWIDPEARRMLFAGRATPDEPYAVWRVDLDGRNRRRVISRELDCGRAAGLPDGRFVFAAALPGRGTALGTRSPWALFVAAEGGAAAQRITFGAGLDLDPTVLRDGRVCYASWLPAADGRAPEGQLALLTVHTDGTGVRLFHGDGPGPRVKLLPRHRPDGSLAYRGGSTLAAPALWLVDSRDPLAPARECVGAPAPTIQGLRVADVQRVHPRPVPQGHLSMVKSTSAVGRLLCIDARSAEGAGGRRVRVRALPDVSKLDGPAEGRLLGEVALEADGSFFVEVPADRPLRLELLDAEGALLRRTVTPFWVRPNESRGCIGCHEPGDAAPPNVRPLAIARRPVRLLGGDGKSRAGS